MTTKHEGTGRRHVTGRPRRAARAALALALAGTLLAACADRAARPATDTAPVASVPPAAPDAPPLSMADAAETVTDALLSRLAATPGRRVALAVDPFLDRATGTETAATRTAVAQVLRRARGAHPGVELRPFTPAGLADQPLVMLGSVTAVAAAPGRPTAYRLRAVLVELRTGRVLDRAEALVRAAEVSTAPAPFFRDSPGWLPDPAAAAYLRTADAAAGEAVDPLYVQGMAVQALVADGMVAYEAGRYQEALARYTEAEGLPAGDQMRVYNGVYLSFWELGRRAEAEAAFGRVVDFGLRRGRLAVKFSFRPGSDALGGDPRASAPYGMWLRQIARGADERAACLELTGHSSPTGAAAANERLALRRAERLSGRLLAERPGLRGRLAVRSAGAREPLVGTGADDASDALDRRVEIEPIPCPAAVAAAG